VKTLDLIVIVAYLVIVAAIGLKLSGRQKSATDYFVGERNLPWWAVAFSIIATETSTLTVISVPGVAFLTGLSYVELAIGYILGRVLVAFVLLPLYFKGKFRSAYEYLGERFGPNLHGLASLAFLITRLLAEGVRLFASAIPIKLLLGELGVDVSYFAIIAVLTAITLVYTYIGGIKAVIWTDVIQMSLYVGGALLCVIVLLSWTGLGGLGKAEEGGRLLLLDFHSNILTNPYAALTAIVGGAIFAMASHGSDQLIVQRVLSTRSLRDGQKAMIGSGCGVLVQFLLFSLVGALLWVHSGGQSIAQLGLDTTDQLFPRFILDELPAGVSGLLIAGILAATMGSLSAAINSLSNSTVIDLVRTFYRRPLSDEALLKVARASTVVWAVGFVVFASMFQDTKSQVIVIGLSITGYTYGALLGAFLLGILVKAAREPEAIVAFLVTVAVMAYVVLDVKIDGLAIAFPWYVPMGVAITLIVGGGLTAILRGPAALRNPELTRVPQS
jgi:SSS family solute:Na+ symporter